MTEQMELFSEPAEPTWAPPKKRNSCGRDPQAGPGSCWYWWEGCPKAHQRGCYHRWARSEEVVQHWLAKAPARWTESTTDTPAATVGELKRRGLVETRDGKKEGERWQWRRKAAA